MGDVEQHINVGTIVIATGSEEIDPTGFYGFGEHDNVITQLQLEQMLKENTIPNDLQTLVMINCVGSKEEAREGARTYCCRVGCGVSLKNAKHVKEQIPGLPTDSPAHPSFLSEENGQEWPWISL